MVRKGFIIGFLLISAALILSRQVFAEEAVEGTLIDLTHPFSKETIYWPTSKRFEMEKMFGGETQKGYFYAANNFCAAEHGGTHLDAPIHFAKGGETADEVPLEHLIGEAVVIDVSERSAENRDYEIQVEDFLAWEKVHGRIPEASMVLLRTGFGVYWPDARKYLGTERRGRKAIKQLHFPGLHRNAALWLVKNRKAKAVGIDTASIDRGQSRVFKTHRLLLGRNIPVFENLAHLDRLPPKGAKLFALPMKIKGGSGAPLRAVALLAKEKSLKL